MFQDQYFRKARLVDMDMWPSFKDGTTDGDTMIFNVDLGYFNYSQLRFRVKDIDTPELNSINPLEREHARAARDLARELLKGVDVVIQSFKAVPVRSFDRFVVSIQLPDGRDFATVMKEAGMEKKAHYRFGEE